MTNEFDLDETIELLRACDDEYFNTGTSTLSDAEYDNLKRIAFRADPTNEYFIQIGSDVRGGKIKLPYAMGSLNQIYEGEVRDWVNKYNLNGSDVAITDKLDGISCLLIYNNKNFSIAYSRGNGIEGADITRHVKHIPSLPKSVDVDYLAVRAEVIMKNSVFSDSYSKTYKNARNMVAGCMNRKETESSILSDLDIIAYEIVHSSDNSHLMQKSHMIAKLAELGFTSVEFKTVSCDLLDDRYLNTFLKTRRVSSDFELDGIVITVNDHAKLIKQSASSSLNPEHSVKYKVVDENSVILTTVKDVHWEISKNGFLKPRVEIFPVELFGTTVRFATGFNAGFIRDSGIGPGAKIKVTKAGSTIPYILEVVSPVEQYARPSERQFGEWSFNENGVEAVVDDLECSAVIFKQVLDFFETYKVEHFKEASLLELWNFLDVDDNMSTYDDIIYQICDLTESEWVKVIGANGSKIYKSLKFRMTNSGLEVFLGACRYMGFGFGVRKAKMLLSGVNNTNDVWNLTMSDVIAINGFNDKTAKNVIHGLPKTKALMDKLVTDGMLEIKEHVKTSEMNGVSVVMTGFRDALLQETIEKMGGSVGSGVSKKTTHLLCVDTSSQSTKMKKARDMGVKVMTPEEFKMEFGL